MKLFVHLFFIENIFMAKLQKFTSDQIKTINNSVAMAEELVCNFFKMSVNQWLRHRYDVKTLVDLDEEEIVHGPFAQIIRYKGRKKDTSLGSSTYDFYKICLQDHAIISVLDRDASLMLFSFVLYVVTHELIHIVRFAKFLMSFDASPDQKIEEETIVHEKTHEILFDLRVPGLKTAFEFYEKWRRPIDDLKI